MAWWKKIGSNNEIILKKKVDMLDQQYEVIFKFTTNVYLSTFRQIC